MSVCLAYSRYILHLCKSPGVCFMVALTAVYALIQRSIESRCWTSVLWGRHESFQLHRFLLCNFFVFMHIHSMAITSSHSWRNRTWCGGNSVGAGCRGGMQTFNISGEPGWTLTFCVKWETASEEEIKLYAILSAVVFMIPIYHPPKGGGFVLGKLLITFSRLPRKVVFKVSTYSVLGTF